MRQRLDDRRMHRKHGVEEMRETDAMRLGDEPKMVSVAVEAPGFDLEPSSNCLPEAVFLSA